MKIDYPVVRIPDAGYQIKDQVEVQINICGSFANQKFAVTPT